ncbi:DNA polymerase III subunit gamma and tau [uncultured Microbacterium sp.]|uniref:DNA polymerase III subunit gamma and tau n=1 Tax=uncultured Microbacterium sp. TaxID=191216 RepID=UPI0026149E6E|nr:DNA polymerase III subunit gamma and tau [uncultured Microbacterium sp.]
MTAALYRRYRPETFAEMIGQSQVTDPLMTALRGDRVGHAYLFSGPRGCGKTTSARILARCLNCAEGPTDTPCGKCPSCMELSRNGGGSLDVVEIDAASHNGVDDARDLRERATFAPSRDRYKIFILDEAHMVTPQGFNALLKLVEEPPEHVKFIFATTEPEKVLGTIRSRTHHYPFRLVPPAAMLEYVEKLCGEEGVQVEQGVLSLVVRAGGGSPRDTLSLLDQLIAGSDPSTGSGTQTLVTYERAVALLGYTHAALLDEIVEALAAGDAAAAFPAVDRVVQSGQDPRRFVDDLLERLRDLIVIAAVGEAGASSVLRGLPADEMQRMLAQAASFGASRLSRTADLVSRALDDMTGATSPRLHLELMVARVLAAAPADAAGQASPATPAPAAPASPAGTASPATRTAVHEPVVPPTAAATRSAGTPASAAAPAAAGSAADSAAAPASTPEKPGTAPQHGTSAPAATVPVVDTSAPAGAAAEGEASAAEPRPVATASPAPAAAPASESSAPASAAPTASAAEPAPAAPAGPVTFERIQASWPAVLKRLESVSRTSWLVATGTQPLGFNAEKTVLTLGFASPSDLTRFKGTKPGDGPSDHLRAAIEQELGITVKYRPAPLPPQGGGGSARVPSGPAPTSPSRPAPERSDAHGDDAPAAGWANPMGDPSPVGEADHRSDPRSGSASVPASVMEWAVATIPTSAPAESAVGTADAAPTARTAPAAPAAPAAVQQQFAVDEEPAEAEAAASAPPAPPTDGAIDTPPEDDYPPFDDEPPYDPAYDAPVPDAGASRAPRQAPAAHASARQAPARQAPAPFVSSHRAASDGVERRGEAVIRQVLGAKFLREEPYEPPTRFH